jgi:ubiquinone biosynthesis protein COQ4
MHVWAPPPPVAIDLGAALRAIGALSRDPNRLDQVLRLGEAVNRPAFPRVWAMFTSHPEGRRVLADRPHIDEAHVDLAALTALPDGTLGREYVRFLTTNRISPKPFAEPPRATDPRAAFLMMRLRQTHDLWHVVTGYTADVDGEILLQAFTLAQMHTPLSLILVTLGTLRYGLRRPALWRALGPAFAAGKAAKPLPPLYWEERWAHPVVDVRRELGLPDGGIARAIA